MSLSLLILPPKKKSLICFEVKIKKLVKKGENNKVTGDWGGTLSFVHENLTIVYHVRTTIGFKSLYFFPSKKKVHIFFF